MDKEYSHQKSEFNYENNEEFSRRSEGEIYSDPESSEDLKNRSWEKSDSRDRDRRRKEKRKTRDSSRSRSEKKDKRRKEKKRHRRRSSYSSRSRSRSRSRSHSRSRSRSRSRTRSRSLSWSRCRSEGKYRRRRRSYDSHASNDSDWNGDRWNQDKFQDSYKYQEPNSTIMVRGLASHLTELDIRQDILKCGIGIKDIRLIRHRETGASRGFAFVEFNTVQEASRWMDMKKGLLILEDQSQANLIYSVPKSSQGDRNVRNLSDWHCTNCQGHNFKRRDLCYKCHAPRPEEQDPELSDEVSSHPTSTIILSGLDALTTEEKVLQAFEANSNLASMPIRSVRIARESITNLSRGLCYVETNNVADAVRLFNALSRDSIEIDSRRASIAYCKPCTVGSTNKSVAATALAAAQWTNSGASTSANPSDPDEIERLAQYSASVYAKTPEEHASYLDYYREYYRNKSTEESTGSTDTKKGNESSSSAACDKTKTVAASGFQASRTWTDKTQAASSKDFPDTSRFQYDDSCGYYYDPVSELYYDPSTHYFYDSKKQQFLYWNSDEQRYIPVKGKTSASSSVDTKDDKRKDNKRPEKQDKVKVAKKIAKEMEKWAKTLNQKKEYSKLPTTVDNNISTNYYPQGPQKYESFDSNYSNSRNSPVSKLTTSVPESSTKLPLTPYDDDSDSEDDKTDRIINPVNPSSYNFADYVKMACLLCKRQFPNKDVLDKHMKLSDLHKQNMDKFLKEVSINQSDGSSVGLSTSYRDRAQERRMKFGPDQQEAKNSLKDLYIKTRNDATPVVYEEPSKDDNIGNRMLQKMGWQEGQGLGRVNQGRTEIISAERRAPNLGLGLRGNTLVEDEPDRYCRERKLTLARYQELE